MENDCQHKSNKWKNRRIFFHKSAFISVIFIVLFILSSLILLAVTSIDIKIADRVVTIIFLIGLSVGASFSSLSIISGFMVRYYRKTLGEKAFERFIYSVLDTVVFLSITLFTAIATAYHAIIILIDLLHGK
jgi:hypothetical protein